MEQNDVIETFNEINAENRARWANLGITSAHPKGYEIDVTWADWDGLTAKGIRERKCIGYKWLRDKLPHIYRT